MARATRAQRAMKPRAPRLDRGARNALRDITLHALDAEVGAAILGPAAFRRVGAELAVLTVADDRDPARNDAVRDQVVLRHLRAALAKAGTPIPENDIWIAAVAQEHGLPLAARDQHFNQIAGLQVLQW